MIDTRIEESMAGQIAIVGMAGRFPGARNVGELWQMLREGREATEWPEDEQLLAAGVSEAELADPNYVRATLPLPGMEMFDAGFFGFSKRDAAVLDPQHRHFLECAWEALEDAGHPPERFEGAIGVFGGCGMQAYMAYNLLTNPQLMKSMGLFLLRHTGNDKDFLTTRVSYLLDLKGPSIGVQTACSTSLVAVHVAAQSLLSGECDMALAGGASIDLPHGRGYRYADGEILSPDGHCRAFDDEAAGTLFGSGVGIVVLRRLADAVRDGDHIYAVIRGSAVNNDGSGKAGYLAPSIDGQAGAAVEALAVADVDPRTVAYVEAHGTGTPVGDPIELAALTQAYGAAPQGSVGIGSLKTNIGHLDTAAGVASLIKVCQALRHGQLPATLNYTKPNSRFDTSRMPFRVQDQPQPWVPGSQPRRAAVNSLGVGGTNAHVIVEEAPRIVRGATQADAWQVFHLSAKTESSLQALRERWHQFLAEPPPEFDMADAAYTTQEGRRAFPHRLSLVARDVEGLRAALKPSASAARGAAQPAQAGKTPPPVVFLFPGGGAQFPGAGRDLLRFPAFQAAVDECLRALPANAPSDLATRLFAGDASKPEDAAWLEAPSNAIPALFILEYALGRLWLSWGVKPAAMLGHSAGEYAAACLAGVLSLSDALKLVVLRGRLFEASTPGGMLSVDLSAQELQPLVDDLGLDIGAINAPDLCLVSGRKDLIAKLQERLAQQGVEGRRLRIDVAAHSRLLDGILDEFREGVRGIALRAPSFPILSSLTGEWLTAEHLADGEYWVRHLRQPVQFAKGLGRLFAELPEAALLETGPGTGLGSLARHNGASPRQAVLASGRKADEVDGDIPALLASAGALWSRGVALDWAAVRGAGERRRIPLPTYAFDHERHWIEPGVALAEAPAASAVPARTPQRLDAMDDWFQATAWHPTALPPSTAKAAGRWLVFGCEQPLAASLSDSLTAQGGTVVRVAHAQGFEARADGYALDPTRTEDLVQLLEALEQAQQLPDHIVHFGPLQARGVQAFPAARALAFDAPVALARAIQQADLDQPLRLSMIASGSQPVGGRAPIGAAQALALGPCRVIPRELPQVRARLIDLDPQATDTQSVSQLVAELCADAPGDLVAWRDGKRWQPQSLRRAPKAGAAPRLEDAGVYLITGGLGGIGLELADFLARRHHARLALVGRSAVAPRAQWATQAARADGSPESRVAARLLAIEAAGARVACFSADVSDAARMAQVLQDCERELGAVQGVFHAAGEMADAPLSAKPLEDMHRLMVAKAQGAQVLSDLLPAGRLRFFAVFSSTSVELGPPGQVDYVAANAMLEAVALARPDGQVLRWGVWADIGMAARAQGAGELPVAAGGGLHPLLGARSTADGATLFEAVYDASALWVLDEHRVAGHPVLPGTGYIEIARAAMDAMHPGEPVELQSLSFEEALHFEGAPRRVQVRLRAEDDGYEFLVRSRATSDANWTDHARGSLRRFIGSLTAAPAPNGPWQPGRAPQARSGVLAFGPRWNNLARMRLAQRSAVAELVLPEAFHSDLPTWGAHPAMLDMAATFGLHLLDEADREQRLWAPVSVDRVRLMGPLPARLTSRVELRGRSGHGVASFDVSLHGPDGVAIATLEGFTMRALDPALLAEGRQHHAVPATPLPEAMRACGILAADAPALFERMLQGDAPLLTISSMDLRSLRPLMTARAAKPARPAAAVAEHATPAVGANALSPVEEAVAQVWRELLGVEQIGRDDDFFALGGHSLIAVRLFAKLRKQFGADLPLATLFEAPTLGRLAALVAQYGPQAPAAVVASTSGSASAAGSPAPAAETTRAPAPSNVIPLGTRAWSPLVEICRGQAGRRALFCVHGAGGNVLNFKLISDRVGNDQPFYGLQAQGVDGRLPPLQTVEAMASQYLEAIKSVQPEGPYRLAGYSAGGVIALEMAQRLRAEGHATELLVMIDTLSPDAARKPVPLWRKLWLARHWSPKFVLDWPQRRRRGREIELRYTEALEQLARGEPLPPELVDFHLFRNFVAAQARYHAKPYPGDVVLVRARESEMQYLQAGRTLGWEAYIEGGVAPQFVDGSHFSMMNEPGLSQLANGIRAELERVDAGRRREPDRAGRTSGRGWWRGLAR